jgi:ACR3 family arsenite transporter
VAVIIRIFGFQGEKITSQPLVTGLLAVPIPIYANAGLAYGLGRRFGVARCVVAPAA